MEIEKFEEKITDVEELKKIAKRIRKNIVDMVYEAQSGHPGGSLSVADILTVLYFNQMNISVKNPKSENRDRLVLSKGHCSPALYSTLAERGFIAEESLKTFRKIDSNLQGHPDMNKVNGVDMTSGSLGQGLSVANGIAISAKIDKKDYRVYCVVGDGEIEEGQIWEACMTAGHYKLDNLCVIVDNNNLQIDGTVKEVMNIYPIKEKFESFGFTAFEVNGNNIEELIETFESAKKVENTPTVIIAKTVKGKGISYMENNAKWHGKAPNEEEYKMALSDIEKL